MDSRQAIFEQARTRGYDEGAARRIAARGGDDRYEMPGTPGPRPDPVAAPDGGFVDMSDELRAEVWKLVHTGYVVNAVKLVRERTGLGLKESKDLVDSLRQSDVTLR